MLSQQLILPLRFPEEACEETFHGAGNRAYLQMTFALIRSRRSGLFYLSGGRGGGKTHFLKAACTYALNQGLRCAYFPCQAYETLQADCLDGLEQLDLIALDDLPALQGKMEWETALFHLINRVLNSTSCQLLITASSPPGDLDLLLPDLNSRLYWGHMHTLEPLSTEELVEAVCQRAHLRGLSFTPEVARFLIKRVGQENPSLVFEILNKIDQASFSCQRKPTIPFIRNILPKN